MVKVKLKNCLVVNCEMLNEEFNIELQPTQIKPDIWRSVKSIAEYIQQLLK